jgi:hypothetical protein
MLSKTTRVFVVSKNDGHVSDMTLDGWYLSMVGGSRWDEVEIYTDRKEAQDAAGKYKLISHLSQMIGALPPAVAVPATQAMIAEMNKITEMN